MSLVESGDIRASGNMRCGTFTCEQGVTDSSVATSAGILASKLQHEYKIVVPVCNVGTSVASVEIPCGGIIGATATLRDVRASALVAQATAGNSSIQVNRRRSGVEQALLSTPAVLDKDSVVGTLYAGTVNATYSGLVVGDTLSVDLTYTASGGTAAQGVQVIITLVEDYA